MVFSSVMSDQTFRLMMMTDDINIINMVLINKSITFACMLCEEEYKIR